MKLKVWGARGSIPAPGPETMRYGGNTSCVEVELDDGTRLILDAGTGIRDLGVRMPRVDGPIHLLLTHLHLDHIQGLMFFAPLFRPEAEITIWGPPSPEALLCDRIARYISAPLAPVEIRELPSAVSFHECEAIEWEVGSATIRAQPVNHRGPTLGYRITEGDTVLTYIPDHEPGLGTPLDQLEDEWISGFDLARGATLLIHDAQYTDEEYRHHLGWGHSPTSDALTFARRVGAEQLLLFHHDPLHSDEFLDGLYANARSRWVELGGAPDAVMMAKERAKLTVEARVAETSRRLAG